MYHHRLLFIFSLLLCALASQAKGKISLDGQWQVTLEGDPEMYAIQLPGTTDMAGLGTAHGLEPKLEKPQVLHLARRHSFVGTARYSRQFFVPEDMDGTDLQLTLERVMWKSRVWIDGKEIGMVQESLTTPHRYTIPGLTSGPHEISIEIDNTKQHDISVNDLAHAYTNDTQVMWNGILGEISIRSLPKTRIESIEIYPDAQAACVGIKAIVNHNGNNADKAQLSVVVDDVEYSLGTYNLRAGIDTLNLDLPLNQKIIEWSEFSPKVYNLQLSLLSDDSADTASADFGFREIRADGQNIKLNGKNIFLRGTLECCIFPLTGCPPTDHAGWQKVMSTAKAWGLNHLRFHSWCPPKAAFEVADSMGMYLQIELPQWSLTVGQDSGTSDFIKSEFDNIIREYGNHPSFCFLSAGNELQADFQYLNSLAAYMKAKDPRRLYTTTTFTFEQGHGLVPEPEDQYFITQYTDLGWIRGQGIFDAEFPTFDKDYVSALGNAHVPVVSHEIGQYAVYPNLDEISKYTGTLDPVNFKAVEADLKSKGLRNRAHDWMMASGALASILYKEEIERALKSPGMCGFQLLDLHDFPGQGTALVGMLDAFWEEKGFISADEWCQWCAPVVPLARFPKATYTPKETFTADIEIANYSLSALTGTLDWQVSTADQVISSGTIDCSNAVQGGNTTLGSISCPLASVSSASQLTLTVKIDGTPYQNSWKFWVYPTQQIDTKAIVLTRDFDKAIEALSAGQKVLFSPSPETVKGLEGKFVPVFWSPVHFPDQAGTMGICCDPEHPALAHFPTASHSDWQWWRLAKNSKAMILDGLPEVGCIVENVDNFANNRCLSSIFEAKCGSGSLIVSSIDLLGDSLRISPEGQQMLYSLVEYMKGASFKPSHSITPDELKSLIQERD
ncbi:MAG: glycoside hydrolase family 2 [Bacteroidales bacterium]|nr:glycoside hydrolase family 2 [Bacteroidales bacterium]